MGRTKEVHYLGKRKGHQSYKDGTAKALNFDGERGKGKGGPLAETRKKLTTKVYKKVGSVGSLLRDRYK